MIAIEIQRERLELNCPYLSQEYAIAAGVYTHFIENLLKTVCGFCDEKICVLQSFA